MMRDTTRFSHTIFSSESSICPVDIFFLFFNLCALQIRLLEEEEREKREEEERKERRRAKEREKKLRRKERLKVKEMEREIKNTESKSLPPALLSASSNESCRSNADEAPIAFDSEDSVGDAGDLILSGPRSPDECPSAREDADAFILEQPKSTSRKLRFKSSTPEAAHRRPQAMASCDDREKISCGHSLTSSRFMNGKHRQFSANGSKPNPRDGGSKFGDKLHSNGRVHDRCDFHSCACGHSGDSRAKEGHYIPTMRSGREVKIVSKAEAFDPVAPPHRIAKYGGHGCFALDSFPSSAGNLTAGVGHLRRGKVHQMKQVWEPADPRKKCPRDHSDHDGSSQPAAEARSDAAENGCEKKAPRAGLQEPGDCCYFDVSMDSDKPEALDSHQCQEAAKSHYYAKTTAGDEEANSDPLTASSSSDNCSSCLSEGGDSTTTSSSAHNAESSSISDSEDPAGPTLEVSGGGGGEIAPDKLPQDPPADGNGLGSGSCKASSFPREDPPIYGEFPRRHHLLPLHSPPQLHVPVFPVPAVGFHTQNPAAAWAAPVPASRLVPLPQPHQFVFPHPLGYGLAANPPPDVCNAIPPPAAPLLHPGHFPSFKAVHSSPLNEPQRLAGGKEEPAKSPSFSLFHFGGPMAMATEGEGGGGGGAAMGPAERRSELDCSRTEAEVEYSLFSSTNGVRFSFLR